MTTTQPTRKGETMNENGTATKWYLSCDNGCKEEARHQRENEEDYTSPRNLCDFCASQLDAHDDGDDKAGECTPDWSDEKLERISRPAPELTAKQKQQRSARISHRRMAQVRARRARR